MIGCVTGGFAEPVALYSQGCLLYRRPLGTAAGLEWKIGLPVKIRATSDVKKISQILNGTWTALNGGTIAAYVSTASHSFTGTQILAATTDYVVDILTTYNSENDVNVA